MRPGPRIDRDRHGVIVPVMRLVLSIAAALACAPANLSAQTKPVTGHPSTAMVKRVTAHFKATMAEGGITGTSRAIQACYDSNIETPAGTAECVLWDISAVNLDNMMRRLFVARGSNDPGPGTPFLAPKAYAARVQTYGRIAFGADPNAIDRYLGNAPGLVLQGLPD